MRRHIPYISKGKAMYPKIKKLVIEIDNEVDSLTLDQVLEQVSVAYEYVLESRQCYTDPNEVDAPIFHPDGGEVGWWEMSLHEGEKQ